MRFTFEVVVDTDNFGEAVTVMRERLEHEEEYGFNYTVRYRQEARGEITGDPWYEETVG